MWEVGKSGRNGWEVLGVMEGCGGALVCVLVSVGNIVCQNNLVNIFSASA